MLGGCAGAQGEAGAPPGACHTPLPVSVCMFQSFSLLHVIFYLKGSPPYLPLSCKRGVRRAQAEVWTHLEREQDISGIRGRGYEDFSYPCPSDRHTPTTPPLPTPTGGDRAQSQCDLLGSSLSTFSSSSSHAHCPLLASTATLCPW